MPTEVLSPIELRTIDFTAAELGFTTALIGNGTLVTLVERLPKGWSVIAATVKTGGTITNATGTTVVNIGVTGSETAIVNGVDIEGAAGYKTITVVRYDSVASIAVVARVVTATAAASPVAGVQIGVQLAKYAKE